jgi:hypothetical protein
MATKSNPTLTEAPGREPRYRKPTADLYTVLLVIALLAILVSILFCHLELTLYDYETKSKLPAPMGVIQRGVEQDYWNVEIRTASLRYAYRVQS